MKKDSKLKQQWTKKKRSTSSKRTMTFHTYTENSFDKLSHMGFGKFHDKFHTRDPVVVSLVYLRVLSGILI